MAYYREHVFPWLVDRFSGAGAIETIRDRVVEQATGHVIEVGAGTGANFLSYANSVTSLTTIEPNPGMNRRARTRIKYLEFPVDSRELSCADLPMKDGSFDCAVMTFTLCSFEQPDRCLAEIFRVLKPGGKLLFVEHGLSESQNVAAWQQRLTPFQRHVCVGCHLNRAIDVALREANFTITELEKYYLPKVPKPYGYMYEGVAEK